MIPLRTAALALVPLLLFGCARSDSGSASPTTGGGGKRLRVVYIPKNTGNPYFDAVDAGFKDAAKQFGFDYASVAPASAEATAQIPFVKDQIQQSVDVIALSPNGSDTLDTVLDQARARGIAVVTVDADVDPAHRDAAVLTADPANVGASQVELLGRLMGYQGDFAILSATTDAPNQNAWIARMKDTLKGPKYARMRLVDTVYGDDEPQKSTTEFEGLLTKYPSLKGVLSPTSVGLSASAQSLDRTKKPLQLTGLSLPSQMRKFVKDGTVAAFQLWSPRDEGFLAAYVGIQIKAGKLKPESGKEIDVPTLGKRKISDKLELYGGDVVTFDKSNVDKYDF